MLGGVNAWLAGWMRGWVWLDRRWVDRVYVGESSRCVGGKVFPVAFLSWKLILCSGL